jgi:hypothetical protein
MNSPVPLYGRRFSANVGIVILTNLPLPPHTTGQQDVTFYMRMSSKTTHPGSRPITSLIFGETQFRQMWGEKLFIRLFFDAVSTAEVT